MTSMITHSIQCDGVDQQGQGCGARFTNEASSFPEIRRAARTAGWIQIRVSTRTADLCPRCAQDRARHPRAMSPSRPWSPPASRSGGIRQHTMPLATAAHRTELSPRALAELAKDGLLSVRVETSHGEIPTLTHVMFMPAQVEEIRRNRRRADMVERAYAHPNRPSNVDGAVALGIFLRLAGK